MNLNLYFENQAFEYRNISKDKSLPDLIFDLNNVYEEAIHFGDSIGKSDKIYDVEIFIDIKIYEVLYCGKANDKLTTEEIKLLTLLIDHTPTISEGEYNIKLIQINSCNCVFPDAFLGICQLVKKQLFVSSMKELLSVRRFYMSKIVDESNFLELAPMCFPNIYFHPSIGKTLKHLSAPFSQFSNEIIHHLSCLNDEFPIVFQSYHTENMDKVLEIFSSQEQIAASMQGNPKDAQKKLTYTFATKDGSQIDIVCEPHTKLEKSGHKGDGKYRFDRIYFHQGMENIENGKILVAHIGKHL